MRKLLAVSTAVLVAALAALPAGAASTRFRVPSGYRSVRWAKVGPGLDHVTIRRATGAEGQSVNVARLSKSAPFALRAVVSDQRLSGGLERTSSMCARTKCAVAINGDFFVTSGQPVGGLAILGQAIRSPDGGRPQLLIGGDRRVSVGTESWAGRVLLSNGRGITLDGVNVPLRGGKISLFTAAYGRTTGNRPGVAELGIQILQPRGPLVLGQEATIKFTWLRTTGNAPIPADGAVIAGEGAGATALQALYQSFRNRSVDWRGMIEIRSSSEATESIGGAPVLLRDGRRAFTIVPRGLVQGRHPRTVVGWNKSGEVFLVTIDGRQPGHAEGMTLLETAEFMRSLGATDAINLDGGGSTTFVARNRVVNSPSDVVVSREGKRVAAKAIAPGDQVIGRPERAVATALVVVPVAKPAAAKLSVRKAPAPPKQELGLRFMPIRDEPAVRALLAGASSSESARVRPILVAFALATSVGTMSGFTARRRLSRRRSRVPA